MKISLIAKHFAWGAVDNFYKAFKSMNIDVKMYITSKDKYNRSKLIEDKSNIFYFKIEDIKDIIKDDYVIFFSPIIINHLFKKFGKINIINLLQNLKNKPSIFITGTIYINEYKKWNKFFDLFHFYSRFAEPELVRFHKNNIPLFHPMEYNINLNKDYNNIIISHAPGIKERVLKKGTDKIINVINKLKNEFDFIYDHIVGVPLEDCLYRKSKSHIFIDQLNTNVGGIGKNGLEAISLDCITLCSINNINNLDNTIYKNFPIINIENENELYNILYRLLSNKELIFSEINKISQWKEKINFKNTVNYIMENLRN